MGLSLVRRLLGITFLHCNVTRKKAPMRVFNYCPILLTGMARHDSDSGN